MIIKYAHVICDGHFGLLFRHAQKECHRIKVFSRFPQIHVPVAYVIFRTTVQKRHLLR